MNTPAANTAEDLRNAFTIKREEASTYQMSDISWQLALIAMLYSRERKLGQCRKVTDSTD